MLALLSYPVAYVVLYALVTTWSKENHFLQIVPFTGLLAGVIAALFCGWLA